MADGITVDLKGTDLEFKRTMDRAWPEYQRAQVRKIEMWADKLRMKVQMGSWFKNPTPNLQNHLWSGRAKTRGRNNIYVQAGWGDRYGPVLEFGVDAVNQKGWAIKPKATRSAKAGSKRKPHLRFQIGDKIIYKRAVWHPWNYGDKGSAPHWSKALEQLQPKMIEDLGKTLAEALTDG